MTVLPSADCCLSSFSNEHFKPPRATADLLASCFKSLRTTISNHFISHFGPIQKDWKSLQASSNHILSISPSQTLLQAFSSHFACCFKLLLTTSNHGQPHGLFETTPSHFRPLPSSSQATWDHFTRPCEAFQTTLHHLAIFLASHLRLFTPLVKPLS